MSTLSLEQRLQRLEDIEAIKDLMARYFFHINKGWNGKEVDVAAMPTIFAEDATWESEAMGMRAEGLPQIMSTLQSATEHTGFSMHSFTNPVIEVSGDQATGNWLMWIGSRRGGGPPNEVFMSEDVTYVRTPQGWRVRTVDIHFGMMLNNGKPV